MNKEEIELYNYLVKDPTPKLAMEMIEKNRQLDEYEKEICELQDYAKYYYQLEEIRQNILELIDDYYLYDYKNESAERLEVIKKINKMLRSGDNLRNRLEQNLELYKIANKKLETTIDKAIKKLDEYITFCTNEADGRINNSICKTVIKKMETVKRILEGEENE